MHKAPIRSYEMAQTCKFYFIRFWTAEVFCHLNNSMHRGPDEVLLAMKVQFQAGMTIERAEEVINQIESKIRGALPSMHYIFIEPDSGYSAPNDARSVPS